MQLSTYAKQVGISYQTAWRLFRQGVAHPRRLGIAAHLGVLLDRPSIGCAKSRLVGEYLDPPRNRGGWSPLFMHGKPVGQS